MNEVTKIVLTMVAVIATIVGLALLFSGPSRHPQAVQGTTNVDYQVSLLFENDGCKVYRFMDTGYYRYYVVCKKPEDQAEVSTSVMHAGKTSHPDGNVPTVSQ